MAYDNNYFIWLLSLWVSLSTLLILARLTHVTVIRLWVNWELAGPAWSRLRQLSSTPHSLSFCSMPTQLIQHVSWVLFQHSEQKYSTSLKTRLENGTSLLFHSVAESKSQSRSRFKRRGNSLHLLVRGATESVQRAYIVSNDFCEGWGGCNLPHLQYWQFWHFECKQWAFCTYSYVVKIWSE